MNAKLLKQTAAALIVAMVAFSGCIKAPVTVSGVSLNKTTLTLAEGGSETLTAAVMPGDAENKTVTWAVTGDDATIDQSGKVTAVKGRRSNRYSYHTGRRLYGQMHRCRNGQRNRK
ncbi:MAG: Ig-like domain-containing protein [Bacteroidales bacterium]|jgi:hypothetical protein|nr:Ig-like domain-containing protein [Bacteroidales bacterium]